MVLICMTLMISDVGHLFMCSWLFVSLWRKVTSLAHFWLGYFNHLLKGLLSPLDCHCLFIKDQLCLCWVCFWDLCFVSLICMSILHQYYTLLIYCSFTVSLKVRWCQSSDCFSSMDIVLSIQFYSYDLLIIGIAT